MLKEIKLMIEEETPAFIGLLFILAILFLPFVLGYIIIHLLGLLIKGAVKEREKGDLK